MPKRKGSKAVHDPETLISKSKTLDPVKDDFEEEEEEQKAKDQRKGFFACYLLTSLCPRFKGHTYIGFTVNPRRRIRQHNGEIRCGAVRTKKRRPWEMVLCIYGFPTNVSALQFEWAWQHPMESLAVRQAAATFKSFSGVANKIKLAYTMLNLPNWESLNITVNYFSTKYSKHSSSCPSLPEHMKVQVRSMDELPCYTERDESLLGDEDSLGDEDYNEASENSGSLEEKCGDATINFSADYSFSIYEDAYEQCGQFKQYGNEQPRDSSCLEVNCQEPFGLLSSLETTASVISSTSAEDSNELGRQRSEQCSTAVNDEEKQKWTAEEEAALKAGVRKHGTGKWRTILSDPEFSAILHSRSNVDLKDKWRNINVTAIWGSRQKAKLALKKTSLTPKLDGRTPVIPKHDGRTPVTPKQDGRTQMTPKHDDNTIALSTAPQNDEVVDAKPLAISSGTMQASGSKEPVARLDKLILEAISNLKEPNGSDRASIASYIEDQYWAPANLRKLLATKLKFLSANGTLIKAKHKYRITPNTPVPVPKRSPKLLLEGRQKGSPKAQKKEINILTKSLVDADLSRMRGMTAQEAAAAAAQAIAEAEVAIAEAEEAAREAERAEAEAEAAQVFAKAAIKALKCRALHT